MGFEIHTFIVTSGAVHTYMYMYVHTCSTQNEILDYSKQVYPDKVREINEKLVLIHSVGSLHTSSKSDSTAVWAVPYSHHGPVTRLADTYVYVLHHTALAQPYHPPLALINYCTM